MERLRRTQIYLPDDLTREIDGLARGRGTSRAELLRQAAREFVAREMALADDDPILGIVGMFDGGPSGNVSVEHDRYLADLNSPPTA